MAKKSSRASSGKSDRGIARQLATFARRMADCGAARPGSIVLRLRGAGGGTYSIECAGPGAVRVATKATRGESLLEVEAEAGRIQAILEGKRNARHEFFSGSILVRGNIQYAIDLAYELGFIRERF